MPEKHYLFTPGPTQLPPEVLEVLARPAIHPRGPAFKQPYERVLGRLKEVFRTEHDVLLFSSSGTGAFESAVANLTEPGERALVVSSGSFGERWADMATRYGADVDHLRYAWGETPDPVDAQARAAGAAVVYVVHSETSTGVVSDVEALAAAAKDAGALVVVDAISSIGAVQCETDAWGLDVVVCGSQKALMTPPGLGLVSVSPAALAKARETSTPRFYFDWERTREAQAKLDTSFTLAVPQVLGLDVALGLLLREGLEAAFERHVRLGRATRAGIKAMGLELASPDEDRSAVVTTVHAPDELDVSVFLLDLCERLGVQLIGGQGEWSGKVFRIGHLGWFDIFDLTTALVAVEDGLAAAGVEIERRVAVAAALEAYEAARV
ncbi:MAG: alanine--glyoxylate aminotransferase family protein [Actinomycetota bacterium]|nr:alanine--glyoxylate aminotransferase family protein [Actinomycetota bacterium]MDQ3085940.1 alanine--glyoxylate aminotransferase family protein [Actinomycetota bacterium]